VEGGLLGSDLIEQIFAGEAEGQRPQDFGLPSDVAFSDHLAFLWNRSRELWESFQSRLEALPQDDPATSLTRDRFVIPLLELLGYQPTYQREAIEVDGRRYHLSHRAEPSDEAPFIHIVGIRQSLDRLPPFGPRMSPHAYVQDFLNRTEHLWAILTNGAILRLLRDSQYLARQAFIEFNLQEMFANELFADFQLFVRLVHRSRLPKSLADADQCLLERYYRQTIEQGNRVRDKLRDGVEKALNILGTALLQHPKNQKLREKVRNGALKPEKFYQQLLRLIYRLLFLLVAEERNLIGGSSVYRDHYSVSRLRRLTEVKSAWVEHHDDLWLGLQKTFEIFSDEQKAQLLGVAPLNGDLFSRSGTDALNEARVSNADLLKALWYLCWFKPDERSPWQRVNYAQLDVEELGSIYESLLDFHPTFREEGGKLVFELVPAGMERKSTGSYYTPRELVGELIKSALEPVLQERLEEAKRIAQSAPYHGFDALGRPILRLPDDIRHLCRELRKSMTPAEQLLWECLRDRRLAGLKFRRQHAIGRYIVDFYCHEHRLIIELEGSVHDRPEQAEHDKVRKRELEAQGFRVLTFRNEEVLNDPEGVLQRILEAITPVSSSPTGREEGGEGKLAEKAILSIKVLDPACGSGHFLLAAARRLATELAKIRTGEEQPNPEAYRIALRDVVRHCIYGVDKNPLAVELCKVALWIESHAEGKPLAFLDHRIKCGDSLVGVLSLDALEDGIPDEAFDPVAGDDKKIASHLKKQNRTQRANKSQLALEFDEGLKQIAETLSQFSEMPDDVPEQIREKERRYQKLQEDPSWWRLQTLCHLWTAAFFAEFTRENLQRIPTSATLFNFMRSQGAIRGDIVGYAWELAQKHRFFHWELEFPEVFKQGGFDVILCNPPWERIKLQEEEFFSTRDPEIANAPNKAARQRLIQTLPQRNPSLWQEYRQALHDADALSKFLRGSGRFPLTARGDINTYSVFAELFTSLVNKRGRVGVVIPTGIATDATNQHFFRHLVGTGRLVSLYDFENREGLFSSIHRSYKFSLLTLSGKPVERSEFAFFLTRAEQLRDEQRRFTLSPEDFALLNPNTRTCPIFRTRQDAELTKAIYKRVPVLVNEQTRENPWNVRFLAMFHMANDSHLFRTRQELEAEGYMLVGNRFIRDDKVYLPLYEAKMIWHYDHRFGTYEGVDSRSSTQLPTPDERQHADPNFLIQPWYWVPEEEVEKRTLRVPESIVMALKQFEEAKSSGSPEKKQAEQDLLRAFAIWLAGYLLAHGKEEAGHQLLDRATLSVSLWSSMFQSVLTRLEYWTIAEKWHKEFPLTKEDVDLILKYFLREDASGAARAIIERRKMKWLIGFRNVTNATNERTAIFSLLPRVGVGHKIPLLIFDVPGSFLHACFLANTCSISFDYAVRQKIGGTAMDFFHVKQFPILPPSAYTPEDVRFIVPRVLELVYTSWDIKPFTDDVWQSSTPELKEAIFRQWEENRQATGGNSFDLPEWASAYPEITPANPAILQSPSIVQHSSHCPFPPFKWDEERRARLRAELDAYYARLYGLARKQLRYILDPADLTEKELADILDPWEEVDDPLEPTGYEERCRKSTFPGETFRVLKEKEIRQFGEYRTRRLILEAWERLKNEVV
jgi:very-short-patch-repair endonuclease